MGLDTVACRWRPEECSKQSEHRGARAGECGHVHVSWQAHLPVHRCYRRSERSTEPSCEAGTHSWDGQVRALSSARPHGSFERVRAWDGCHAVADAPP